jgi:hypothetical protein
LTESSGKWNRESPEGTAAAAAAGGISYTRGASALLSSVIFVKLRRIFSLSSQETLLRWQIDQQAKVLKLYFISGVTLFVEEEQHSLAQAHVVVAR